MNYFPAKKTFAACLAGTLFVTLSAQAQVWTNATEDNSWMTPGNWEGDTLPGIGGEAVINLSGDDRAVVDTDSENPPRFGRLRVGQGGGTNGQLDVIGGFIDADDTSQDRIGVGGGTGVVNQSGGTVQLSGNQVQLGLDGGSSGTYNLSGGTFIGGRESGGTTLFVGQSGGTGVINISGGELRTRAGVELGVNGGTGTFNVQGSAATEIGIGAHGTLAGRWIQNDGSTLQFGIDAGGVTPINIFEFDGAGGDVTFQEGALLDVGFVDGPILGTWTAMQWDGTLTDNGLAFAEGVDSGWSFDFVGNEMQLSYVPEPSTYALIFGGLGALLVFVRRRALARS